MVKRSTKRNYNLTCAKEMSSISAKHDFCVKRMTNFVEKIKKAKKIYKWRSFYRLKHVNYQKSKVIFKIKKRNVVFYLKNNLSFVIPKRRQQRMDKRELKKYFLLSLGGGFIGFLNGFFGGGGGMVCVPVLNKIAKLDEKHSHATAIAIIFPLSLISAFIYVINGYIKSLPLITVTIGSLAGGIIGAFALKILPPKWVRIIFAVIMLVGGIKLIL